MRWDFATWVSDAPTGGNVYDRRLLADLPALGVDVREHRVDGPWPRASAAQRGCLAELVQREQRWLVDAIVACGAPDVVTAAVGGGRPVVVVLHSFMSAQAWRSAADLRRYAQAECTVLRAATGVVCTSRWSADEVARRYGRVDAAVARPGVDPAPLATGTRSAPCLLALGTVCAPKDQLTLVRALAGVCDLAWTARIVGAVDVEPDYVARVRTEVVGSGLAGRVEVVGPRTGADLEALWQGTDLLVQASLAETYGMVVVEALARGVPSVVTAGTGGREAQLAGATPERPGAVVRPGDPAALAATLRRWLTDAELRRQWRQAALQARTRLPGWDATAREVATVLRRSG